MAHVERRARAHRFPEVEGRRGREVGPGLVRDVVGEEVVRAARSHVQDQVELARRQTKGSNRVQNANRVQNTGKQNIIQWQTQKRAAHLLVEGRHLGSSRPRVVVRRVHSGEIPEAASRVHCQLQDLVHVEPERTGRGTEK